MTMQATPTNQLNRAFAALAGPTRRAIRLANTIVFSRRFLEPLALQLLFLEASESMGNHDSKIVDAGSVD